MNKLCKKCSLDKPIEQFRPSKQTKDGLFSFCRECQDLVNKLLYEKNKIKRIQQVMTWNELHPDKLKVYKDTWRKNKNQPTIN